jgi:hypothetical protein
MSANTHKAANDVRHAFSGLPFEQKLSTLIRIELDMLGDAVEAVVSAASKAVDDIAASCCQGSTNKTTSSADQASTTGA